MADNKPIDLEIHLKLQFINILDKNKDGKTWYYKTPYTKMAGGKEEYNKAVKKITEAYKEFVKKNKFLPNHNRFNRSNRSSENRYRVELIAIRRRKV